MNISLDQIREKLTSALVSDALDALGLCEQSPRLPFRPLTVDSVLVGRAKTTLWVDYDHEVDHPYELELRAVDDCEPDSVFVAAAGSSLRSAVWGELLSTAARNRGCVGAVVDGAARDLVRTQAMDFPVYALTTSPYDSRFRQRVVDIDVPVQMGGTRIAPGDLVIADRDGVVAVPAEAEAEAIQRAWEKANTENEIRSAIGGGMRASEAYERFGTL